MYIYIHVIYDLFNIIYGEFSVRVSSVTVGDNVFLSDTIVTRVVMWCFCGVHEYLSTVSLTDLNSLYPFNHVDSSFSLLWRNFTMAHSKV